MNPWILLSERDHVVVALRPLSSGERLRIGDADIVLLEDVPKGHKLLIRSVGKDEPILKFGYSIGRAKGKIPAGSWIHTHNMRTGLAETGAYSYEPGPLPYGIEKDCAQTFNGYLRDNGEAGIRNEIWIINTVGCINRTCETIAKRASRLYEDRVDGIYHFAHPFGCSQLGDDLKHTRKLLASLVNHPNAGAVLVVGLGCENNQIADFREAIGEYPEGRVRFMRSQDVEDEIAHGLDLIDELVQYAEKSEREPIPVSKLKLGLKCGGSDGFSGITANPLAGAVADMAIAAGGTAILTEVPEMFGAETILMNRAKDEATYGKIVHLIDGFKRYFVDHGQPVYENPSPGNKDGGITTLEEKSLGCTQKGGHAIVTDVLAYGDRVHETGLNLLESPGNDLVSVTALSAAGAQLVLFTTGRGTPFGGPVPTVKIASNSELALRKKNWIDFNAGSLFEGGAMEQLSAELWTYLLALASGEVRTNNENNDFREIAIFKDGVIL